MIKKKRRHSFFCLGLVALLSVSGCGTTGPKSIPRDQFNYNEAISESSNEQLLLNLVRLRYSESPVFLKVNSVISQYQRAGSINASAGYNNAYFPGNAVQAGAGAAWSNNPTITYTPVSGHEFSQNLLTPLPPGSLFSLIQSGWDIDLVLRITAWAINGINDDISRPSRRREADSRLFELLDVWYKLSMEGIIGIKNVDENNVSLFINSNPPEEQLDEIKHFCELLNLDQNLTEYNIKYGLIQEDKSDITVLTGSIWEIMLNLSWQFEVPPDHLSSGRTMGRFKPTKEKGDPPVNILYSKEEPDEAFISVKLHDYWFYISQNDRDSKRVFSFLQLLLSLAENVQPNQSPSITIPTK